LSQRGCMKQDRFLIAILAAVSILVITALVLFFIRQEPREYGSEDTPEGIVRNYVIALLDADFEKAYGYMQDKDNKPDYQEFQSLFLGDRSDISDISVSIKETKISEDIAVVKIILTHSGPLMGNWTEKGSAVLVIQENSWKLKEMPFPYWGRSWYQTP